MAGFTYYAYAATLPNGQVVHEIRRNELMCAVASRVRTLWRLEMWSAHRKQGERYAREWLQKMHVMSAGSKLQSKDYEARVLPVVATEVPPGKRVEVKRGSMVFRKRFYPEWGQNRPLYAILGGGADGGWKAVGWPTTDLERDLLVFTAKRDHPRVEAVPVPPAAKQGVDRTP